MKDERKQGPNNTIIIGEISVSSEDRTIEELEKLADRLVKKHGERIKLQKTKKELLGVG